MKKNDTYRVAVESITNLGFGVARCDGIVTFVSNQYETEWMHLFTATEFTGSIKECDEGKLEWIEKSKVFSLPMWEGDKIFFDLLNENVPFFSLKLVYEGDTLVFASLNGERIR